MPSRSPTDPRIVRAQVLAALGALAPLAESFEPVGSLVEEARMALAGESGLTAAQVQWLRTLAARWSALDPRLRELYSSHIAHSAVQGALMHLLLSSTSRQPAGVLYGQLRAMWSERYGHPPSIDMLPWLHLRRVAP